MDKILDYIIYIQTINYLNNTLSPCLNGQSGLTHPIPLGQSGTFSCIYLCKYSQSSPF